MRFGCGLVILGVLWAVLRGEMWPNGLMSIVMDIGACVVPVVIDLDGIV